jgi:uncharacterized protein
MLNIRITLPLEAIREYCQHEPITRLAVFGSVLRDDFGDNSDVDLLVEYQKGAIVTLLDMARQEIELTAMIGRKVDLRTPKEISRYFRQEVLDTAQVIYDRTE